MIERSIKIVFFLFLMALGRVAMAEDAPNIIVNGGFETDLSGWRGEGAAAADSPAPIAGKRSLRLGPGKGAVRQNRAMNGLRIIGFGATIKAEEKDGKDREGTNAAVRVQCFDAAGRSLMDLRQPVDPKRARDKGDSPYLYFKTAPRTASITLSIESDGPGIAYADNAILHDFDKDRRIFAPLCDLDQYMKPLWTGNTIHDESVLLYAEKGKPASGRLLLAPERILSVRSDDLKTEYVVNKDYTLDGRTIARLPDSAMPMLTETDFPKGDFPWLNLAGKQIVVSYTHSDSWRGPVPTYQGDSLPGTVKKLKARAPLTVVALGDSITLGLNVSGYRQMPPYMPTWADLFVRQLRKRYGYEKITLFNAGLGGQTSEWGKGNAETLVASANPDLVLIAFGMNDFWYVSGGDFRKNVAETVRRVRVRCPKAEFILISSMPFDPAYTADPVYSNNRKSYGDALRTLIGPGVRLFDMAALAQYLYDAKKPRDLVTDPMHPNDFLARIYAQGLTALLTPDQPPAGSSGRTFHLDPAGDDAKDGRSREKAWKSLSKVNATPLEPGDEILLTEGAEFAGNLTIDAGSGGTPKRPIVVRSSGMRPATIISPDKAAIYATVGGVEIRNLTLKGGATKKKEGHDGIAFFAKGEKGEKLRHVRIDRVTISGFGGCGVSIGSLHTSRPGFEDVRITNVTATQTFGPGIFPFDSAGDPAAHGYAHKNLYVGDCDCSDNRSGSGIIISGCDGALVERCRAANNVGPGGGVGIWAYATRKVIFRQCIASGTRSGGKDGGGFDLDGGCFQCIVENCLAYENDGPGYMHCDYPTAFGTRGNIIRNSLSINDGRKKGGDAMGFGFVTWGSGLDDCRIENNLVLVTENDPKTQDAPLLFATQLTGSQAKSDVLHIRGCIFKNNRAVVSASGTAFVLNDLPRPTLADVLFEGNGYHARKPLAPLFLDGPNGKKRFATLTEWQKATGQEMKQGRSTARPDAPRLADAPAPPYRLTDPHRLPDFPLMKALK